MSLRKGFENPMDLINKELKEVEKKRDEKSQHFGKNGCLCFSYTFAQYKHTKFAQFRPPLTRSEREEFREKILLCSRVQ